MDNHKKNIHLFYPQTNFETGQQTASKLTMEHLQQRWGFYPHCIPTLDRSQKNKFLNKFTYIFKILCFWSYTLSFVFSNDIILYFNIGQSWNSIIRDGFVTIFIKLFRKKIPLVLSLHGNWFTQWPKKSLKSKVFLKILSSADIVTVLGSDQKKYLINGCLNEDKIKIVPNSCQITPCSQKFIEQKHYDNKKIKILYLSNLIESKGYKHFLSMLQLLHAVNIEKDISVFFCGNFLTTGYSKSSPVSSEKTENIIKELNKPNFKVDWVKSVTGQDKNKLFQESHIFVFPSQIEAQPIVILEAMASGSTIISSRAGLIPSMIDESSGILLKNIDPNEILVQTKYLIENDEFRVKLAKNAIKKYKEKFSISSYTGKWDDIFTELNG